MSMIMKILSAGLPIDFHGIFSGVLFCENVESVNKHIIDLLIQKKYKKAISSYQKILTEDKNNLHVHYGIVYALVMMSEFKKVRDHLVEYRLITQKDFILQFVLGYSSEKLEIKREAKSYYENSIQLQPVFLPAHKRLAAISLSTDDIETTIEHLEQISFLEADDLDTLLQLAALHLQNNSAHKALQVYEQALLIDSENWDQLNSDMQSCMNDDNIAKAIHQAERLVKLYPEKSQAHSILAQLYEKNYESDRALDSYLEAYNRNKDSIEIPVRMATILLRRGNHEESARWFSIANKSANKMLQSYVGLAIAQIEMGQVDASIDTLRMAGEIEPNSNFLFEEMSRVCQQSMVASQAEKYLNVKPAGSGFPGPLSNDIDAMLKHQIQNIEEQIKWQPGYADLHYNLGILQKQCGKINDAIDSFRKAIEINPHYTNALLKLGFSYRENGNEKLAINCFKRIIQLDPSLAEAYYQLGLMYQDSSDFQRAVENFSQASELKSNVSFQAHIAMALENMGQLDQAEQTWQQVLDSVKLVSAG